MTAENQITRVEKLAHLGQLCQEADERTEAVYNTLEEMVTQGEITNAEYDLLISALPRTNLHDLRERLALAVAGKLRPGHMSSLLDSILG